MPRYVWKLALLDMYTMAGTAVEEFWIGIETEEPVNLTFLSEHGYHLVPAEGMTEEELQSVGVMEFEPFDLPVRTPTQNERGFS
jgi:hypothetical protein